MIRAIQNSLARMPLRIMLHDPTPSLDQWLHLLQKRLQTLAYYISVARYDLKNPKTAPETSNHYQCKSIYRTTISFKLEPGQNSKDFQLTIFEFVQPKKNMSLNQRWRSSSTSGQFVISCDRKVVDTWLEPMLSYNKR